MELIVCPQRFRKVPISSVHTYTQKQRFQKVPLWRAFSKSSIFIDRFYRTRVDGNPIRQEKAAFSNENGYVFTGPKARFTCIRLHMKTQLLQIGLPSTRVR